MLCATGHSTRAHRYLRCIGVHADFLVEPVHRSCHSFRASLALLLARHGFPLRALVQLLAHHVPERQLRRRRQQQQLQGVNEHVSLETVESLGSLARSLLLCVPCRQRQPVACQLLQRGRAKAALGMREETSRPWSALRSELEDRLKKTRKVRRGKGKGGGNVCKRVPGKGSTSSRTLLMRFSTTILQTFSGLATVALVSLDDVASNFRSVKDCVERYNRHACYR